MAAQLKPLFIPWLRTQICSQRFPGVDWTNPDRTEFCVPWKHALRQDSSSTDILIFKAWAEKGSGNGPVPGDPSVWKRNFRSTLRAKHFVMVTDNSNDSANPHKVFRWPEEGTSFTSTSSSPSPSRSTSTSTCTSSPSTYSESQEEEELSHPVQEESPEDSWFCVDLRGDTSLPDDIFIGSTINSKDLEDCLLGLNLQPADAAAVPEERQQPIDVLAGAGLPGLSPLATGVEGGAESCPEGEAVGGGGGRRGDGGGEEQPVAEQFMESMSQTFVEDHFRTQFRVSVFYRGVKVSENLVMNEAGFKLVYRPEISSGELDPDTGLTLVTLPPPPLNFHPQQTSFTQRVLDSLGAGLDVGVSGFVVYSHRHGDAKAFWSRCKFDCSREPQEVPKTEPQCLFQFQDFVRGIMDFIAGGRCPSCCLYVCLGEKWPDPDNKPWEKKLVMVEVVFTSLESLKMIAEDGGASSLQSEELQLSLEQMMETLVPGMGRKLCSGARKHNRKSAGPLVTSEDLDSKLEQVQTPEVSILGVLENRLRVRRQAQGGCSLGTCQTHNLANTLYQISRTSGKDQSKDTHDPRGYGR
ncbi:unnamed protein product [Merluccius merluccius]